MVREEVREHRYQAIPIPPLMSEPVYHRNAPRRVATQKNSNSSRSQRGDRHDEDDDNDNNHTTDDWATRCLLPGVVMFPSVVLPREEGMDDDSRLGPRRRRLQRYGRTAWSSLCGRRCALILGLIVAWNLVAEDWWWPLLTWNREEDLYPTKILTDFSYVGSVDDLKLDSSKSLCQPVRVYLFYVVDDHRGSGILRAVTHFLKLCFQLIDRLILYIATLNERIVNRNVDVIIRYNHKDDQKMTVGRSCIKHMSRPLNS